MNFKTSCPNCTQRFEVTDDHIGMRICCSNCSKNFTIQRPPAGERGLDFKSDSIQKRVPETQSEFPKFEVLDDKNGKSDFVEYLKFAGDFLLAIGGLVLLCSIGIALKNGAVWSGAKTFPWLINAYVFTFGVCLLITPLLLFRGARGFVGNTYIRASYVFGITTWVWSLLLAYSYWGVFSVIIGLVIIPFVGVFPVALLACLFHANWSTAGELFLAGIVVCIVHFKGALFITWGKDE
jgi:hypothetical protein